MSSAHKAVYKMTGGRGVGGAGKLLLLSTTGAKTGRIHEVPVMYIEEGGNWVVVASKAGSDHHPDWYRNLVANPDVEVLIGRDRHPVHAQTMSEYDAKAMWPRFIEMMSSYDKYRERTDREIPVVALSLREDPSDPPASS